MTSQPTDHPPAFFGWRMLVLACLCVNLGVGFTFGAYGTFMAPIVTQFSASRSLASAGLSLMVVTMGLLAPVAGYTVHRWSIRATLAAGFILMSAGWGLMSLAANTWQYILAFGALCGAAAACLIVVPPMTLVNNWFIAQRGRAAGIVMIPILLILTPPLAAAGITAYGWRTTALAIALITLVFTPLTRLVIDRPDSIGQRALGTDTRAHGAPDAPASAGAQLKAPTREPLFWVLMVCAGVYSGAGVAFGGHFVSFALGLGLDLKGAAFLLSIFGAAALAGSLLGGLLADRIGGARTFAGLAFVQTLAWPCLLLSHSYGVLALWVVLIGVCANANVPVAATLLANVFGRERFARVMGLYSFVTTPFNFALPLLAGVLYDLSGSYRVVFIIFAALFAIVGMIFSCVYRIELNRRDASPGAPVMAHGR